MKVKKYILKNNFNTTLVKVHLKSKIVQTQLLENFNTTLVKVHLIPTMAKGKIPVRFQYNPC